MKDWLSSILGSEKEQQSPYGGQLSSIVEAQLAGLSEAQLISYFAWLHDMGWTHDIKSPSTKIIQIA